ncbi:putative F-box protein At1g67623 [Arachis duranensis]|uniref:F-box protein At1g67623 n=1 Tax=Arachis duranensis TaxID=130453 RepID=A0A6P4DUU1_ARADU|nr:putative F-box protein At1g67623 [Arachis duranensis]
MAGSSQKGKKRVDISLQHESSLDLLPREIWSCIAPMVASNSIQDLFNMQAMCKVFLGAASSDTVYKRATMYKPLAHFLSHLNGPERRFLERCAEVGNVDAIFQQGFVDYFPLGLRDKGMELLARAFAEGSVEAGYLCAMLLMYHHEDEEEVQMGVQMMEDIRISGQLESYSKFFSGISKDVVVLLLEMYAPG